MCAARTVKKDAPLFDDSGVVLITVPAGSLVEAYAEEETFVGDILVAVGFTMKDVKYNGFIRSLELEKEEEKI